MGVAGKEAIPNEPLYLSQQNLAIPGRLAIAVGVVLPPMFVFSARFRKAKKMDIGPLQIMQQTVVR
jgi:hypothetical protein